MRGAMRCIFVLSIIGVVLMGCGKKEDSTEAQNDDPNPWAGTVLDQEIPLSSNKLQLNELAALRTLKKQYNITDDETVYRFDILYGVKAQNPDFAVRTTS